jgi:hypothetical protein
MSVDKRRLAAAQRTAVGRRTPSRTKRLGAWIIIVPALSLFSFSVVAGAKVSQSKPDVAAAAAKVVPQGHGEDGHGGGGQGGQGQDGQGQGGRGDQGQGGQGQGGQGDDDGTLVVVDSSHGDGPLGDLFGKRGREICWISKSQLARVSAVYKTTTSTLKVGHKTYNLVTVYGANDRTLRQLLGSSAVQCKLVRVAHLYFLPFDPNLS